MGWLVTRQGETYIFQYGNTPRSVTFQSLAISLVEGKIKLEEFGKYVMTITFSQFDTIGGIVPTDISNAYDLIIGLGQPPYPVFNFDIGLFGTAMFDNHGIDDEATFITYLEGQGATNVVVTDFTLTSNRLRCGLTFDDMTDFYLSEFGITKIYNVESLVSIDKLFLYQNIITTIENLEPLVNLTTLDLSSNQITTIENLDSLVNLTDLYLSNNQITTIENLDSLVNLTYLYLSYNQITNINNLDSLVNLTQLELNNNQITTIENLDSLVNLTYLDLSDNQITTIENLDSLVNLTDLYLHYNQITTIENLDSLVNLTSLYLDDNQITTAQFNTLNSWAILAPINGSINTNGNTDNFNTSTTYTTLLGKGWSIS